MGREAKARAFRKMVNLQDISPMAPLFAVKVPGLRARTVRRAYLGAVAGTFSIRALADECMKATKQKTVTYEDVLRWAADRGNETR